MLYVIQSSRYDSARPFVVMIASTHYINRVKGRYETRRAALARIRQLEAIR